jgi:hypothetical protein
VHFFALSKMDIHLILKGTEQDRFECVQLGYSSVLDVGDFYGHLVPAFDHLLEKCTRNGQ